MGSSRSESLPRPGSRQPGAWMGPFPSWGSQTPRASRPICDKVFAGLRAGRSPFSALHLSGELRGRLVRPWPRPGLASFPVAPPSSGVHLPYDPSPSTLLLPCVCSQLLWLLSWPPVTLPSFVHFWLQTHLEVSFQCVTMMSCPCQNSDLQRLPLFVGWGPEFKATPSPNSSPPAEHVTVFPNILPPSVFNS